MKKVLQLSKDIRLDALRKHFFGPAATSASYRDSFVICEAIDKFAGDVDDLLSEEVEAKDSGPKTAKSVTFRLETFEKVNNLAVLSDLSYAEVVRRILYYTLEQISTNPDSERTTEYERIISSLKTKILVVAAALDDAMTALNSLVDEVEYLEANPDADTLEAAEE